MVFSPTTVTGTAVLEYGPTEILPQVGALSKHAERLCRPGRQASRAHPRGKPGFWTFESGCGRETDSLLEGAGFEPSVPRERLVPSFSFTPTFPLARVNRPDPIPKANITRGPMVRIRLPPAQSLSQT